MRRPKKILPHPRTPEVVLHTPSRVLHRECSKQKQARLLNQPEGSGVVLEAGGLGFLEWFRAFSRGPLELLLQ